MQRDEQHSEEPDFDAPVDAADEQATFEAIARRNRLRVLIPLAVLISLVFGLSFFGDPIKPKPDTSKLSTPTPATGPAPATP